MTPTAADTITAHAVQPGPLTTPVVYRHVPPDEVRASIDAILRSDRTGAAGGDS